jgi:hypothetical protein
MIKVLAQLQFDLVDAAVEINDPDAIDATIVNSADTAGVRERASGAAGGQ